jgi:restriction system protein
VTCYALDGIPGLGFMQILFGTAIFAAMMWWLFGSTFWFWFWAVIVAVVLWVVLSIVTAIYDRREKKRLEAEALDKAHKDAVARAEWQKNEIKRWHALARDHRSALVLRYRQLVTKDAYGGEELEAWRKEIPRFRKSVGIEGEDGAIASFELELTRMVKAWAREDEEAGPAAFESDDPFEYERWCADVLRQHGWKASTTKASGDQGVDIVASKGGRKVALQCKLYTGPVGNKAVQEIHAAAAYVDAGHAVVVTNGNYTPAARRLASKLGVMLLHDSQLPKLDGLLDGKTKQSGIILPGEGSGLIIRPSVK